MKQLQMAKLAMEKAVLKVLDDHAAVWSNFKPVSAKVAKLHSLVTAFEAGDNLQRSSASAGFTNQKNAAYEALRTMTYKTAMKLRDWAEERGDAVVYAAVNVNRSGLRSATFAEQLGQGKLVLAKAMENVDALGDYQITADSLANFQSLITTAGTLSVTRDVVSNTRQSATGSIAENEKTTTAVLKGLDRLIDGFTGTADVAFLTAYRNVRKSVPSQAVKPVTRKIKKAEAAE